MVSSSSMITTSQRLIWPRRYNTRFLFHATPMFTPVTTGTASASSMVRVPSVEPSSATTNSVSACRVYWRRQRMVSRSISKRL